MKVSKSDLETSLHLLETDFGLDTKYLGLVQKEELTYQKVFSLVKKVVDDLLASDFQRLLHLLYRIDVSESRLKKTLAQSQDDPSIIITELIIERELQKVATRKKYS